MQKPYPPIYFSGLRDPEALGEPDREVQPLRLDRDPGLPHGLTHWRNAIQAELDPMDTERSMDDVEMVSMIWFVITAEPSDQTPMGKGSNLLVGTSGADHREARGATRRPG